MPCPFYGRCQLTLISGIGPGNPPGQDLTLIIREPEQGIDIFIVDVDDTGFGELAFFFPEIAFFGMGGIL